MKLKAQLASFSTEPQTRSLFETFQQRDKKAEEDFGRFVQPAQAGNVKRPPPGSSKELPPP